MRARSGAFWGRLECFPAPQLNFFARGNSEKSQQVYIWRDMGGVFVLWAFPAFVFLGGGGDTQSIPDNFSKFPQSPL